MALGYLHSQWEKIFICGISVAGMYHRKGNEVMIGNLGFGEHLMKGMIAIGYRKNKTLDQSNI